MSLQGKEINKHPDLWEINRDVSAKIYWSYWDALVVKDKILYKRWESPNLKSEIFQIIVPKNFVTMRPGVTRGSSSAVSIKQAELIKNLLSPSARA